MCERPALRVQVRSSQVFLRRSEVHKCSFALVLKLVRLFPKGLLRKEMFRCSVVCRRTIIFIFTAQPGISSTQYILSSSFTAHGSGFIFPIPGRRLGGPRLARRRAVERGRGVCSEIYSSNMKARHTVDSEHFREGCLYRCLDLCRGEACAGDQSSGSDL